MFFGSLNSISKLTFLLNFNDFGSERSEPILYIMRNLGENRSILNFTLEREPQLTSAFEPVSFIRNLFGVSEKTRVKGALMFGASTSICTLLLFESIWALFVSPFSSLVVLSEVLVLKVGARFFHFVTK